MDWLDNYEHLRDTYGTEAALAALIGAHPEAAGAIEAFAEGAPTTGLPAKVAVAALNCIPVDQMVAATEGERRSTVAGAVDDAVSWYGAPYGDIAAMAGVLVRTKDGQQTMLNSLSAELRTDVLSHIATWGTRPVGDTALTDGAAIELLSAVFARCHNVALTERGTDGYDPIRARITAGAAIARIELNAEGFPGIGLADVIDAAAALNAAAVDTPTMFDADKIAGARAYLAMAIWVHGGTIADISAAYPTPDPIDDDDIVLRWLETLAEFELNDGPGRRPIDELLAEITADGRIERYCDVSFIDHVTADLPFDVLTAFVETPSGYGTYVNSIIGVIAGRTHLRYSDAEIADAFAAHPRLAAAVYEHLDRSPDAAVPGFVVDAAMCAHGIGAWLKPGRHDGVVDRLRRAAAAANFDLASWTLLWRLAGDIRGTPEQLVDIVIETAPARTQDAATSSCAA